MNKFEQKIEEAGNKYLDEKPHPNAVGRSAFFKGARFAHQLIMDDVKELIEALTVPDMDCGDNSCRFAKSRGGMRTNGGCRCLYKTDSSIKIKRFLHNATEALKNWKDKYE